MIISKRLKCHSQSFVVTPWPLLPSGGRGETQSDRSDRHEKRYPTMEHYHHPFAIQNSHTGFVTRGPHSAKRRERLLRTARLRHTWVGRTARGSTAGPAGRPHFTAPAVEGNDPNKPGVLFLSVPPINTCHSKWTRRCGRMTDTHVFLNYRPRL